MNLQNEPIFDIVSTWAGIILEQFPKIKLAKVGWPDKQWLQIDKNLPAVFFMDISETNEHAVSQYATHRTIKNTDGTGYILQEKLRLQTLMQMTLFTNDKLTRDQLGWKLKQYFVTNFRIGLIDYTQATPQATGEYMLLNLRGDHKELKGETNFYQRDLTWQVQSRVLEAIPAYMIATAETQISVETSKRVPAVNQFRRINAKLKASSKISGEATDIYDIN